MEALRDNQFRSVHVLRHTFQPNEYLSGKLQQFVNTHERAVPSRFILTSTREVAVDESDFQNYRYNLELQRISRAFHSAVGSVGLESVKYNIALDTKRKPQRLTLRFSPTRPMEFEKVTAPIDTLPEIIDRTPRTGEYFAQVQLDARQLVGKEALVRAWTDLRESIADTNVRPLFTMFPHDISGPVRMIAKPPTLISVEGLYDMLPGEEYRQPLV